MAARVTVPKWFSAVETAIDTLMAAPPAPEAATEAATSVASITDMSVADRVTEPPASTSLPPVIDASMVLVVVLLAMTPVPAPLARMPHCPRPKQRRRRSSSRPTTPGSSPGCRGPTSPGNVATDGSTDSHYDADCGSIANWYNPRRFTPAPAFTLGNSAHTNSDMRTPSRPRPTSPSRRSSRSAATSRSWSGSR